MMVSETITVTLKCSGSIKRVMMPMTRRQVVGKNVCMMCTPIKRFKTISNVTVLLLSLRIPLNSEISNWFRVWGPSLRSALFDNARVMICWVSIGTDTLMAHL